jgi:hypothetical protein
LQHAHNPVDWYPWGPEAFETAEKLGKPIFLSIGYSSCHWCHVMEKESFEDPEVAGLMNNAFISIKVDREERPDIDGTYMAVCQMMTGSGGWPLTIIMTPDRRPFFASTYIPKEAKFGHLGMKELIPRIKDLWISKREQLMNSAKEVVEHLVEAESVSKRIESGEIGEDTLDAAYDILSNEFDEEHGGFGGAPKFPTPHNLMFLLRYWKRTRYEKALWMVEKTLTSTRLGGIYDQVGFGFHRYSVDSRWFLPHFEKMLYDQAMLTIAYIECYQATKKEEYKSTAEEILAFVLHDMTSPQGGFYTSVDADSEGQEGKFYLWSKQEIRQLLSQDEAELIATVFNIRENGNLPDETIYKGTGSNILFMSKPLKKIGSEMKIPSEQLEDRIRVLRRRLLRAREERVHPQTDEKILTDLNGLMIAALAKASQAFNESRYCYAAERAVDFVLTKMRNPEGQLFHRYKDGETLIPGFLDDYAFFAWGLIELYEATFETGYLESAIELTELMISHFHDKERGGFYFTANDAESIIARRKEAYDGDRPSGNSIAALNLLRLAHFTGRPRLEDIASGAMRAFSSPVSNMPTAFTQLLIALDFAVGPASDVVIVGDPIGQDTLAMIRALRGSFLPNSVEILKPSGAERIKIEKLAEFTRNLVSEESETKAYVCRGYKCSLPVTSVEKMLDLLNSK